MAHNINIELNVNEIISRALMLIRAESVFQDENLDARKFILDQLNDLLALMNASGEYVPFYNVFNFNITPGKAKYSIGSGDDADVKIDTPIESIDYVNVITSGYRYPVIIQDNFAFLGNSLVVNTSGLPGMVRINKRDEAQDLDFYPVPDRTYDCQLLYKKQINYVTYQDKISLPPEYRKFLVYWLAKSINIEGGYGTWTPDAQAELDKCDDTLKSGIPTDYRIRSAPPYLGGDTYYWQYNLGVIVK